MSKITESAEGESCTVRLPGICSHDPRTTVFAHLNGSGMALKTVSEGVDLGCYACFDCHEYLDGGYVRTSTREQRDFEHYRATLETIIKLIEKGLIVSA